MEAQMDALATDVGVNRRLNHVEFVHRPGERDLVYALFDLLGFQTIEMMNGEVLVAAVDPPSFRERDNDNYIAGREVRPEQWAFDQALEAALTQTPLAAPFAGYKDLLDRIPQWGMHFGVNFTTLDAWEAAVAKVAEVEVHAPALSRRVQLLKVFRPDDPDPLSPVHQAFIWTDLIASGSLALGQRIELAHLAG
jgi:hypothetical protein